MSFFRYLGLTGGKILKDGLCVSGKITAVKAHPWLKVNAKALRIIGAEGAKYCHSIKFCYCVDGKEYTASRFLDWTVEPPPTVGNNILVYYRSEDPADCYIRL